MKDIFEISLHRIKKLEKRDSIEAIGLSKTFGLPIINQTTAGTQLGVDKSAMQVYKWKY